MRCMIPLFFSFFSFYSFMSTVSFDFEDDLVDLQRFYNKSKVIDLESVDDDEWKHVRRQLVTPAPSVCYERALSRCESVMLFKKISSGESDVECLDLESNDLKDFIDNHSVLMDDYTHTPINTSAISKPYRDERMQETQRKIPNKRLEELQKKITNTSIKAVENDRVKSILARRSSNIIECPQRKRGSFEMEQHRQPIDTVTRIKNNATRTSHQEKGQRRETKKSVTDSARRLLATIQERRKNSIVVEGRFQLLSKSHHHQTQGQSNHKEKYFSKRLDTPPTQPENDYRAFLLSRLPQPVSSYR
ncbi:unnamed protein product [Rhizopus microsporus]